MRNRWRGRIAGLVVLAALGPLTLTAAAAHADPILVVRGPDDRVLADLSLPDRTFTLRYRNSLYRSLAEEHYVVDAAGRIELVGLAADELAVLEEYYAIDRPAWRAGDGAARTWHAEPAREVTIEALIVAGTDLGQRTLLIEESAPLALWRLVSDQSPSVELHVSQP
ncbi:MAG TPA: hypothetical protein VEW95_01285 [Candidatus Limnocylindrales bacterium]|nr:hypothetical protein [Candidatus Limnocylindrales bacterium]